MVTESFLDGKVILHGGDCLDVLDTLPENSIDACVCDPPYHLTSIVERFGKEGAAVADDSAKGGAFKRASAGFMGKVWDGGDIAFRPEVWRKVLRVLKPGAHLLAFSASRNFGRMQVAIEDAGFQTRDCILEILDTDPRVAAFVNSLNDAQRVAFLQIVVESSDIGGLMAWLFGTGFPKSHNIQKQLRRAGNPRADEFAGFGTALKPAFEPIVMGRKPLIGSVGENMLTHGVGAINIDAARITSGESKGRWPANVIHDGSSAVIGAFPDSDGQRGLAAAGGAKSGAIYGDFGENFTAHPEPRGDAGSAARFFWSGKADADDRLGSKHPTVKPVDLIQYLVRMVTTPGQTVLDLFAGTGTTGEAAWREGRRAVLIERELEYRADIARRMSLCLAGPEERRRESIKAKVGDQVDLGPLFGGTDTPPRAGRQIYGEFADEDGRRRR